MANLTPAPALRQFLPGAFEDAFIYMNTLVAVTTDREIVTKRWDRLVEQSTRNRDAQLLAGLLLLRNDYIADESTQWLLHELFTRNAISRQQLSALDEEYLQLDEWDNRFEYRELLGDSTLLDLQLYNQRLFAGTTSGLVQTNLLFEADDELSFSVPVKRTDARCMSMSIRYGTLAASCGKDGLLMSYDEFSQLSRETPNRELSVASEQPSVRSSWLGYNLVNYATSIDAYGFRSRYEAPKGGRQGNIVTALSLDEEMLTAETDRRSDLDFLFNAHSTFFSHYENGEYELRVRRWSGGRLGVVEHIVAGTMRKPISTHRVHNGFVAETYDAVVQVENDGVSMLYSGESVVVRTFPASQWYRNLVLVVADDGLHIVSPVEASLLAKD